MRLARADANSLAVSLADEEVGTLIVRMRGSGGGGGGGGGGIKPALDPLFNASCFAFGPEFERPTQVTVEATYLRSKTGNLLL